MQIAQALNFLHLAGVIHGDLTSHNVFLDEKLNAKVADFAGSSLDGSPLLIAVTASHEYPGPALSAQGDFFAFGSVLYEIMTGNVPYADLAEDEILDRYAKHDFPSTDSLQAVGKIITKCWQGQYDGFELVVRNLSGIYQFPNSHSIELSSTSTKSTPSSSAHT